METNVVWTQKEETARLIKETAENIGECEVVMAAYSAARRLEAQAAMEASKAAALGTMDGLVALGRAIAIRDACRVVLVEMDNAISSRAARATAEATTARKELEIANNPQAGGTPGESVGGARVESGKPAPKLPSRHAAHRRASGGVRQMRWARGPG